MEHQVWQLIFNFPFVADGITTLYLADVIATMADGIAIYRLECRQML